MTDSGDVAISLTSDEALVLYDLLRRWEDAEQVSAPDHKVEQVLYGIFPLSWSGSSQSHSILVTGNSWKRRETDCGAEVATHRGATECAVLKVDDATVAG